MSTTLRRDRFLRSLTHVESTMFNELVRSFISKSHDNGIHLTADAAMRCAAFKIDAIRRNGMRAAITTKVGRVPTDWPDVDEKPERIKRKRTAPPGQSEAEIQKAIVQYLILSKWLVVRINSGAQAVDGRFLRTYTIENNGRSSGMPDVIAVKDGRWLLLEVKTSKGRLSESQQDFHQLATAYGVQVHVVRSIDDVEALVMGPAHQEPKGTKNQTTFNHIGTR